MMPNMETRIPLPEKPRLRPGLACDRDPDDFQAFLLWDRWELSQVAIRLSRIELDWVFLCDGERTLVDIQSEAIRRLGGLFVPLERIQLLVEMLQKALFLEGSPFAERLQAYLADPIRDPAALRMYDADPQRLRRDIEQLFVAEGGCGLPRCYRGECGNPSDPLRAVLVPHMDYQRGGVTYGYPFRTLVEQSDASLFVIIGTSHYSPARFSLTRKHFRTPLGLTETHQEFVDAIVAQYGEQVYEDPFAHLPEHSIELEVAILQYLLEGRRPFRIVPLLVGSFHDCVELGMAPAAHPDIQRMIQALRSAEAAVGEKVCYLISGDLAHIGPKFGDPGLLEEGTLEDSRRADQQLLQAAVATDADGFYRRIAAESDQRRICGFPPLYTTLQTLQPGRGELLHYQQFVHPRGIESVSFASVAFYA